MHAPSLSNGRSLLLSCLGVLALSTVACNESQNSSSDSTGTESSSGPSETGTSVGIFTVKDGRILKDGKDFVIKGANVNGEKFGWSEPTLPDVNKIVDVWKMNAVRINAYINNSGPEVWWHKNNQNWDELIQAFTSKGVVVIIEWHDESGSYYRNPANPAKTETKWGMTWTNVYPSLDDLTHKWREFATRYKDNPYVWFNVMNEPGSFGKVTEEFKTLHEKIIKVIREDVKAPNIIVVDGRGWASEEGGDKSKPVEDAFSAILTYGPELSRFGNIVYSMHPYASWNMPGQSDQRLADLVDRITKVKQLPLIFGEWGEGFDHEDTSLAAERTLRVARDRGLGHLVWHWVGNDGFNLTTNWGKGNGIKLDSSGKPINLSWAGEKVWNETHGLPDPEDQDSNRVVLDRSTWRATASDFTNDKWENSPPQKAIDGNRDTHWKTSADQKGDGSQWFKLDLGYAQNFNKMLVQVYARTFDYPRGLKVYVSNDPNQLGEPIAQLEKNEQSVIRLNFPTQKARYLTLVNSEAANKPWIIKEIYLYTDKSQKTPDLQKILPSSSFGSAGIGSASADKLIDGDINTAFDAQSGDDCHAGFEVNQAEVPVKLRFHPRGFNVDRMVGGKFQASSDAKGPWTDLYTIPKAPEAQRWSAILLANLDDKRDFRYFRYVGPKGGHCNIAEMELFALPQDVRTPAEPTPANPAEYNPLKADEVPQYIPESERVFQISTDEVPPGFKVITPMGGAVMWKKSSETGSLEIASLALECEFGGQRKEIARVNPMSLGGAYYLAEPWFGNNDYHEKAEIQQLANGHALVNLRQGRVFHFWGPRYPVEAGTKACDVTAVVKITGNGALSLGADWWKDGQVLWNGPEVNNKEAVTGDFYGSNGGVWQRVRVRRK